ncbi:S-layer homology domain-containing protein, partial [Patescibacteria group bacterium]|nr:S-layer homology domain-containing protein [Patescibacteria group bacterium]
DRDIANHQTSIKGVANDGIKINDKNSTISGIRFYDQTGGSAAIAAYLNTATTNTVVITGVEIDNSAASFGSIYASMGVGDKVEVSNSYVHDSSGFLGGIGIFGDGSATIFNNFVYNHYGAIGIGGENALIYNNIISKSAATGLSLGDDAEAYYNTVVNGVKGIAVIGNTGVKFENNIIAYNTGDAVLMSGTGSYDYNAYYNNGTTHLLIGNELSCNPGLTNINSTETVNYQLASDSSCVDEGTEINTIAVDYFGNDRLKDGDGDATYASDPGAYEVDGDVFGTPSITNVVANPNTFSPDGDNVNDTTMISYTINKTSIVVFEIFEDGSSINTLLNEPVEAGTHSIVWDGKNSLGETMPERTYEYHIIAMNQAPGTSIIGEDSAVGDITISFNDGSLCQGFTDIAFDDPLCPAITYVKDQGIFQGYPDGSFRPYDVINRVETVKVILEGFSIPLLGDNGTNLGFSDVIIGEWYMTYLRTAKDALIVEGYEDGTFRPTNQVNRVELLKVFLETSDENMDAVTVGNDPYPDTPKDQWYILYVQFAKDHALVDTDALGNFNPAEGMKRGDVATLFYRFHQEGFM